MSLNMEISFSIKEGLVEFVDYLFFIFFNFFCKEYEHTKKQCDRHNKIVKQISKLEFEKDIINELMEIFNVKQKEID